MVTLKPRFDLMAFVDKLGVATLTEVIAEIERERTEIENTLSREGQVRFEQMRYSNSLKRVLNFLVRHVVPHDATPKEFKAIQELSQRLHLQRHYTNYPETFLMALNKVMLPKDVFSNARW